MWLHCSQHFLVGSDQIFKQYIVCVLPNTHTGMLNLILLTRSVLLAIVIYFFSSVFIIHFRKACYIVIVCIIGVLQFNHIAFSYMVYPNQTSRTAYETGSAHLKQETTGSTINNGQNNMPSILRCFLEAWEEKQQFHAVFSSIGLNASCRGLSIFSASFYAETVGPGSRNSSAVLGELFFFSSKRTRALLIVLLGSEKIKQVHPGTWNFQILGENASANSAYLLWMDRSKALICWVKKWPLLFCHYASYFRTLPLHHQGLILFQVCLV